MYDHQRPQTVSSSSEALFILLDLLSLTCIQKHCVSTSNVIQLWSSILLLWTTFIYHPTENQTRRGNRNSQDKAKKLAGHHLDNLKSLNNIMKSCRHDVQSQNGQLMKRSVDEINHQMQDPCILCGLNVIFLCTLGGAW